MSLLSRVTAGRKNRKASDVEALYYHLESDTRDRLRDTDYTPDEIQNEVNLARAAMRQARKVRGMVY